MIITKVNSQDLTSIGEIFLQAFGGSVKHLFQEEQPNKKAAGDILAVFLLFEPECFMVAREDDMVVGYIIATKNIRTIWMRSLLSGIWLKWLIRWLRGAYGFRIRPLYNLAGNKLLFVRDEKKATKREDYGRILSIAVKEKFQNKGIGKELIKKGLAYLKEQGKTHVKLEVRPSNTAAYKAYTSLEFKVIGKMQDLQGEWVIMLKKL